MWKKLLEVLRVPETDTSRVQSLLNVLIRGMTIGVIFPITIATARLWTGQGGGGTIISSLVMLLIMLVLYRLNQDERRVSLTTNLFLGAVIIYAAVFGTKGFLTTGPSLMIFATPIVLAALLLTPAASPIWAGIAAFALLVRALASGLMAGATLPVILLSLIGFFVIASTATLLSHSFREVFQGLRRQIQQGRASIEIGHTVTSSTDPTSVTQRAVHLIREAFGYYHVGIFTTDPDGEIAVLRDAAGEGAEEFKARGFHVPLTGTSAVAAAITQKRQRLVVSWQELRDARGRPIQFTYDRLPTRAELAIPLLVGDRVFGALDIHSTELDPFPEEDIHTLEGLVGHISNALEGARLLEDVQRRHQELTAIYAQTERRARYLETTAELARAISSLLNLEELLPMAANLVSAGLDLYHTGIFLIDETGEWAVLMAASSEGGQQMIARGHKLRVGKQGIVGWVTHTGQPRIALDVGADAVYFDNPYLPNTRSEMALPLKIGNRVIGALDVQSVRESAFTEEDVAVAQILADQVAVAIENARLFQETQRALDEVQALQRYYVAQQWQRLSLQQRELKAEYRSLGVPPVETPLTPEMELALTKKEPVILSDLQEVLPGGDGGEKTPLPALSAMAIPIKLRGEVIGVLDVQEADERREWTQEEIAIATAVADQLALALENARLFEETQRRAAQLAAASEVARDATAILEVDRLLEETVKLISEQFGFYHAGAFLLDDNNEYAILRAASSEGGRRMLAKGHKLKVGEAGIVGYVAGTGEPRVALDVGADAAFLKNPYLPETRSEMALPLKVRERVIGVLDVQSTQEAAFSEDDVAVLQTLADQLATAIANANLFQRVREDALRRTLINEVTQAATSTLDVQELLSRAGEAISRQLGMPSVIYKWDTSRGVLETVTAHDSSGVDVTPEEAIQVTSAMDPMMFQAIRARQLQVLFDVPRRVSGAAVQLAQKLDLLDAAYIPLASREQVLGLLALGRHRDHPPLDEGELSFLEVVAANLGVAWENASLYQNAVETAERLAEVDRLKSQFLANMSHELRTPLNSIIGFSRVILKGIDGPLTDMQRTDLQTVYDSGQHLLGLINDILDLSKIEAGKMELTFEDVDIADIVKGVMSTAIALVKDKPIELQQVIPPDLPTVRGDARRIRQVLLNLVSNAAKFTESGFIRTEVEVTPTEVIMAVKDTGIGIPADKLDMIFDPFTQVDGSSTRSAGGTGLGLSICRSFAELHGGRIWVESTLGQGSTFYFALPIHGPSAPEEKQEEAESVEAAAVEEATPAAEETIAKRVLCIEDDEGVITLFRRYLGKQGYQVVGLTDSSRALEEAKRLKPYAITLDVMMPGKDGWEVIQQLKQDPETRSIPVIICSIIAEKGRGLSLGAADYLVKPILEQDLLAALNRLDREAGRHLVLVVDDQEDHRKLLRRMIENLDGYEVVEATGGQEAIGMLDHIQPQIIMLDLMMPEMDGFAVLETVKANEKTRSIPIIIVTAKELTPEDRERLNHHVEALIEKGPLKQDELLADVAAALHKLGRHEPNPSTG